MNNGTFKVGDIIRSKGMLPMLVIGIVGDRIAYIFGEKPAEHLTKQEAALVTPKFMDGMLNYVESYSIERLFEDGDECWFINVEGRVQRGTYNQSYNNRLLGVYVTEKEAIDVLDRVNKALHG